MGGVEAAAVAVTGEGTKLAAVVDMARQAAALNALQLPCVHTVISTMVRTSLLMPQRSPLSAKQRLCGGLAMWLRAVGIWMRQRHATSKPPR